MTEPQLRLHAAKADITLEVSAETAAVPPDSAQPQLLNKLSSMRHAW